MIPCSHLDSDALLPHTDCDPLRVHGGRVEGEPLSAGESPDQWELSIEGVDQSEASIYLISSTAVALSAPSLRIAARKPPPPAPAKLPPTMKGSIVSRMLLTSCGSDPGARVRLISQYEERHSPTPVRSSSITLLQHFSASW